MTIRLSREEARALMIFAQGLGGPPAGGATKEDVRRMVRRLGCVQIDTISVVARSQYLVLWSRLGQYDPRWLDELLYPDRVVFEYWAHAASIIPLELYPYFRRRMREYRVRHRWHHDWLEENAEVVAQVRAAVRERGPVSSSHFARPEQGPVPAWSWWGGKPANRALDILWSTGELGIARRVNFQRHYDLAERLYGPLHSDELPTLEDERAALAGVAVQALGVCSPRWLNDYFRTRWGARGTATPGPARILEELEASGAVRPVEIDMVGPAYLAVENLDLLERVRAGARPGHTTFLSPFDPLIWDRARARELFDFEYTIECYTPAPKRTYGYYNMAILYDGKLVGRLDPKVDRKTRVFSVKSFHLEPGVALDEGLAGALRGAIEDFAAFNGADRLDLTTVPRLAEAVGVAGERRAASGSGR